jgi:hypothetical protein
VNQHYAALLRADPGVFTAHQQAKVVGQLARYLSARETASRHEEGQQPPALFGVALDIGQLKHRQNVVLQTKAIVERFQLEAVLGQTRVRPHVVYRAEGQQQVVVG